MITSLKNNAASGTTKAVIFFAILSCSKQGHSRHGLKVRKVWNKPAKHSKYYHESNGEESGVYFHILIIKVLNHKVTQNKYEL